MKSKSITDIGSKRKVNQDYIYNKDDGIGLLSNLYIVADGMGGHKAGDYASRECVNSIVGYIEEHTECYTPISLLENAIINANNNINEKGEIEYEILTEVKPSYKTFLDTIAIKDLQKLAVKTNRHTNRRLKILSFISRFI